MILSDSRIILQNAQRFLFLTGQRTITSLSFPIGIVDWENQIHLWDLIFGSQNFLFDICFRNIDPGKIKMNSKKMREVFFQNKPIYKNLFHFIPRCHRFEGKNPSLSPIFQHFGQTFRAKWPNRAIDSKDWRTPITYTKRERWTSREGFL